MLTLPRTSVVRLDILFLEARASVGQTRLRGRDPRVLKRVVYALSCCVVGCPYLPDMTLYRIPISVTMAAL